MNVNPWWLAVLGVLGGIAAALLAAIYSRSTGLADLQEKEKETALHAEIARFGIRLESEIEERRAADAAESDVRRAKDDALGGDVKELQSEMSHDYGERGKPRPRFGRDR